MEENQTTFMQQIQLTLLGDLNYDENYQHMFVRSLEKTKIGLIIFLILITVIYNIFYRHSKDSWYASTYFFSEKYLIRVFCDAGISGLMGIVSIVILFYGFRQPDMRMPFSKFAGIAFIVFTIMFLFALAQEGSGLNRYLDKADILEGNSNYNKIWYNSDNNVRLKEIENNNNCNNIKSIIENKKIINTHKSSEENNFSVPVTKPVPVPVPVQAPDLIPETKKDPLECLTVKDIESGGDPFIISVGHSCMLLVCIIVLIFILRMIIATGYGFINGENNVSEITFFSENISQNLHYMKYFIFFIETIVVVGGINGLSPYLSLLIRGEKVKTSSLFGIGFIFIVAVSLHIMFQYNGLYKISEE